MKRQALNFDWLFKDSFELDYINQVIEGDTVDLPHTHKMIPKQYFNESSLEGVVTYQKIFDYDLTSKQRLFIEFEGVMVQATVYLNGVKLINHHCGYTKFHVEITNELQKEDNLLVVEVNTKEDSAIPPFGGVVDYLTYGGIYREVTLIETIDTFVPYAFIDGDSETLNARFELNRLSNKETNYTLMINDNSKTLITHEVKSDANDIDISISHDLTLWSLETPKLYQALLYKEKDLIYESSFGLRTIKVDASGFYLNNERLFLRGLNRHQSFPYVGNAMPEAAQKEDADILKNTLGCNIVRSSHYPPCKHFLNRCDEIGLLVFTELPGWQHIGDDQWKDQAIENLAQLIKTDYNHPSIVIIGTRINESVDDDDFYKKTQAIAKKLDKTRPTGGVRFFGKSNLLEDIYTVNDFSHRGDNNGLTKKRHMTHPQNPYLITEFNGHMYPTKTFDDETHRVNHAKRHFKVLDAAYKEPKLMGAIGWVMSDYNTHQDFGSNDHVCHHGVLDIYRNPKYAASVYASQKETPYLNVLSMMHIGEMPGGELKEVVVATNCDKVKLYKNDNYIGTYSDKTAYPNLPHPPIIIKDLIGNQIEKNEKFTKKDAKRIKKVLLKTLENGLKMTLSMKLTLGIMMVKYKLTYQDAVNLYTKYIGGWGEEGKVYRFEGILNGEVVSTQTKGYNNDYNTNVNAPKTTLSVKNTYDTARIEVSLTNAFDEQAFYTDEVITIKTEGAIDLIGPKHRAITGGKIAFWIKSIDLGKGTVTIEHDQFNTPSLKFKVIN